MKSNRLRWFMLASGLMLAMIWIVAAARNLMPTHAAALEVTYDQFLYLPLIFGPAPLYDWPQFDGDAQHSGNNTLETRISPSNVSTLKMIFQVSLPAVADGAPVYLHSMATSSGIRDLIFVTTRAGQIAALDAHTGVQIWMKQYGPGACLINNNLHRNETCYTTSSPAIDPNRQYVYSYGLDGYIHKFAVGDGTEIMAGGWPELTSLKVYDEKGSSALSIATARNGTSYLYVAHAGYPGDGGNYQGHLTSINLADGTQKVFNTICSNQPVHFVDSRTASGPDCYPNTQSAIWARPGVVYDPDNDKIFMATGNGTFEPGNFMWGDTVFALFPNGIGSGGRPTDSYTPVDFQHLQNADLDIGSTAPAILPPSSGKYSHLAVQGGKDGVLRLIDLDNLSGQNTVGKVGGEVFSMSVPMGGEILTQPAVWVNPSDHSTWIFVSNDSGIAGLQLTLDGAGNPSLQSKWTQSRGTSPIVANGVLFYAQDGLISALNPTNGNLLWSDNQIGRIHWESPIVANGVLYITDGDSSLTAYALP